MIHHLKAKARLAAPFARLLAGHRRRRRGGSGWGLWQRGFALALTLAVAGAGLQRFDQWIAQTVLPVTLAETSTEVLDRNGALLRVYPVGDGIWRMAPQLAQVDPDFIAMLIAYEDKRFHTHIGVDPLAMLRAMGQALWHGRTISGGSTLTMQLARLLEDGTTGAWAGKLRQIRLALALERRLSKQQILGLYLTHAPYGGNLEGIRAASYAWFGKAPKRLTPSQAALLIALPQSPERRRPDRAAAAAAAAARDRVLARLAQAGLLTAAQVAVAQQAPLPRRMQGFPRLAPHLSDRLLAARPGVSRLAVTLDAQVQAKMAALVAEAARKAGPRVSAALLAVDHRSGEILASVGSPSYEDSARQGFVDMTQALRSPGSTLKPLVYGLGFDSGLVHPESLIHDGPVDFDGYAPQNFDGQFRGDLRVREALQLSLNIPVVRLTREIGPAQLLAVMRRGGATPKLPGGKPGLAISLGGIGTSLQDLVQLYAGIAAGGQGPRLRALQSAGAKDLPRMMSEVAAWQLGDILRGLAPPPGARAGVLAYKTGTSYGHRDAWAIGWDGQHVIGVWLGRADGTPVPGAFGGDLAAPVLFEAFGRLKPETAPPPPPPAATLILGAAELPLPLRRFRPRDAVFAASAAAPQVLFPPDGAALALEGAPLVVKLRGGTAPFALLADGRVLAKGQRHREFEVPNPGPGFANLVVVDSAGHSVSVGVEIDRLLH